MTRPTAAPARWPYLDHRTMAAVLVDESHNCFCELTEELGDADGCIFAVRCDAEDTALDTVLAA